MRNHTNTSSIGHGGKREALGRKRGAAGSARRRRRISTTHCHIGAMILTLQIIMMMSCPVRAWSFSSANNHHPRQRSSSPRTSFLWTPRGRPSSSNIASSSSTALQSDLLYQEQEKLLVSRGELEGELMKNTWQPLETDRPPAGAKGSKGGFGGGGGGGFGGGGTKTKSGNAKKQQSKKISTKQWNTAAAAHAKTFRDQGVLRLDKVLSDATADALRRYVYQRRSESEALVRAGELRPLDRFADVLLKSNRCDLPLPLQDEETQWQEEGSDDKNKNIVAQALSEVLLQSPVGKLVETVFYNKKDKSSSPVLYELSCLMSDPGSQRQVVHPDNPYLEERDEPTLLTCFIALQDITLEMGPTTWLPQTHTAEIHAQFQNDQTPVANDNDTSPSLSEKDHLLATRPSVLGILPRGSCGIYDSRLLHCGTANRHPTQSRALFYFSFKNPRVGYPGNPASMTRQLQADRPTLQDLQEALQDYEAGVATRLFG